MLLEYSFLVFVRPRVPNTVKELTLTAPTFQRTLNTLFGHSNALAVRSTSIQGLYMLWVFEDLAAELRRRRESLEGPDTPLAVLGAVLDVALGKGTTLLYDVSTDVGPMTYELTPAGLVVTASNGWQKTFKVHPDWRLPAMTAVA